MALTGKIEKAVNWPEQALFPRLANFLKFTTKVDALNLRSSYLFLCVLCAFVVIILLGTILDEFPAVGYREILRHRSQSATEL
jgi:hypothetical protein